MREKLNIRLPSDDEHEPNPWDSKTEFKGPRWLWDWTFWLQLIAGGVTIGLIAWFKTKH